MPQTVDGGLAVTVSMGSITIDPGDFSIGAVEIKDIVDEGPGARAHVKMGALQVNDSTADAGSSTAANVSGSATVIKAANADRRSLVLTNTSTNISDVVYLGTSASIAVGNGIPLYPGETFEDNEGETAWYGITAGTTVSVAALELFRSTT